MNASIFTELLLPLAIAVIMFGMGLGLTVQDFERLFKTPRAIFAGLLGQILLMPLLAWGICVAFDLPASLAVGLMILAACPGGTMSNLISQIAKANLALSVSLTAISTLICVFTTPLLIQFAMEHFAGADAVEFSIAKTAFGLCAITLLPVGIGMLIRRREARWAKRSEPKFRRFSLIFMLCIIVSLMIKERELLVNSFGQVFFACLALNLLSMLMGLLIAKVFSQSTVNAITLSIEVGVQNATLALLIAISFLDAPQFAVSAGMYGLAMYVGPLFLLVWGKWFRRDEHASMAVDA